MKSGPPQNRKHAGGSPGFRAALVCAVLLVFALSACSRTRLAYDLSSWYVLKRLDSYFDVNASQRSFLKERIDALQTWHKREELPLLVRTLQELKIRYQDGLSAEDIDWINENHDGLWRRFFEKGLADFSVFLTTVEAEQIRHLESKLEKRNEYLVGQTQMSREELLEDILEWLYGFLENWYGSLNAAQREQFREWVREDPEWIQIKLDQRRGLQKQFVDLLRSRSGAETIRRKLDEWVLTPETGWTPEFRARQQQKEQEWVLIFFKIDGLARPDQRKHALDRLEDYIEDFKGLLDDS